MKNRTDIPVLFVSAAFFTMILLRIQLAYADALMEVTEADAKRIATLIKPGDVLLEFCRTCSSFGLKEGVLTARQVISVEAITRKKPVHYSPELPYHVIVTQDLFFSADNISEPKDRNEIVATGYCMAPDHYEVIFSDQRCFDYEGDSNVPSAFRCKEDASLNYTYFKKDGAWQNFANISLDDKEAKPWADTIELSQATRQKIEQCRKFYESNLQKKKQ